MLQLSQSKLEEETKRNEKLEEELRQAQRQLQELRAAEAKRRQTDLEMLWALRLSHVDGLKVRPS